MTPEQRVDNFLIAARVIRGIEIRFGRGVLTHLQILSAIERGTNRVYKLTKLLEMQRSVLLHTVRTLVDKELLTRQPVSENHRRRCLVLTPQGSQYLQNLRYSLNQEIDLRVRQVDIPGLDRGVDKALVILAALRRCEG